MSDDISIENLILQLSNLKITEQDKDMDNLIASLSTLSISHNNNENKNKNNIDEEVNDLIEQMNRMNLADEIKFIILHTINHCRLQYSLHKRFVPRWCESF